MEVTNFTISKEELKQLIEDAVFKATCTQPNLEYNIITEKELSERIGISKVTLHKYTQVLKGKRYCLYEQNGVANMRCIEMLNDNKRVA